jgi:hypothetical protein
MAITMFPIGRKENQLNSSESNQMYRMKGKSKPVVLAQLSKQGRAELAAYELANKTPNRAERRKKGMK